MIFYSAFTIGLLGSLHCLGMCGPIAFALPVRTNNRWIKLFKYLLYNSGRILSYSLLGLAVGVIGQGFAFANLQQILSVSLGILILLSVFFIRIPLTGMALQRITSGWQHKVRSLFHRYFQQRNNSALFILGMLNGLLPCGMVYLAILGAFASGDYLSGTVFMASFGLGTVPMMLGISLAGSFAGDRFRRIFHNTTPAIACAVAVFLIMRGLQVEIPFINSGHSCCHPH